MNDSEFEERLKAFHKKAYYWSLSICRNSELASDILQDAYLKAYKSKDSLKDSSKFKSWLFTIIKNCSYDYFRSHKSENLRDDYSEELVLEEGQAESIARAKGDRVAAEHFLSQLSPREAQIMELIYYQSMTVREVSALLDISTGSVSTYMKRAKDALKGHILRSRHKNIGPSFEKTYTEMIKSSDF